MAQCLAEYISPAAKIAPGMDTWPRRLYHHAIEGKTETLFDYRWRMSRDLQQSRQPAYGPLPSRKPLQPQEIRARNL